MTLLVIGLLAPASVRAAGAPPVCQDDGLTVNEDGTKSGALDCSDPEDDSLTYSLEAQAADGTAIVASDGSFMYTPDGDFNGFDEFSYSASDGDSTSNTGTMSIVVSDVNDPPSFTEGPDQSVLEDAGTKTINDWVSGVSAGPPDESGQTVSFIVSNNNTSLFATQPAISSGGTLTYRPAANANGTATVTVHAHDDGGGSTDDSPNQQFTITVDPVNDPPSFNPGSDPTVAENAGAQSFAGWATGISEGPSDELGQAVSFVVSGNTNASLFATLPAVSSSGTLTFTPASGKNGNADITLHIHDTGGKADGGIDDGSDETFTIHVSGVNDSPSFTVGADQTVAEDANTQTVTNWATGISPGPSDENGQTVTFLIDANTNTGLFSTQPSVSPSEIPAIACIHGDRVRRRP